MVKSSVANTPQDTPEPQLGVRRKIEDDDSASRATKKARTRVRYARKSPAFPAFYPQSSPRDEPSVVAAVRISSNDERRDTDYRRPPASYSCGECHRRKQKVISYSRSFAQR